MIEFRNVEKKYGEFQALKNINFTIDDGEIFGLVGQSGAGKSTLLRTINQLEKINGGDILIDGKSIINLSKKELRDLRSTIGMIFQNFALLETQNVYNNIALPLKCKHWKKDAINSRVLELAKIVGIEDKLKKKPRELSGGQKQRVAIARALALKPKILLCDEATSALDPITTQSILDLLKMINLELNITVVIVTHQMEVVKSSCDRVAIIKEGNILEIGETDELFLSSSNALKTLVQEDEILPNTGVNIKLFFPKNNASDSVITKMARELDIDFNIVWGKLEKFKGDVLGSLIINVKKDDFHKAYDFLNRNNIRSEVITNVPNES